MLQLIVLAAVLNGPPPAGFENAKPRDQKLFALSLVGHGFDGVTTKWVINAGGRELNPLAAPFADSDVKLGLYKVGAAVVPELLARKLDKKGHHGTAKVMRCLNVALPFGLAISNAHQARKR